MTSGKPKPKCDRCGGTLVKGEVYNGGGGRRLCCACGTNENSPLVRYVKSRLAYRAFALWWDEVEPCPTGAASAKEAWTMLPPSHQRAWRSVVRLVWKECRASHPEA
jgi:hypothetical protein